jgi:hypothetical protein
MDMNILPLASRRPESSYCLAKMKLKPKPEKKLFLSAHHLTV